MLGTAEDLSTHLPSERSLAALLLLPPTKEYALAVKVTYSVNTAESFCGEGYRAITKQKNRRF